MKRVAGAILLLAGCAGRPVPATTEANSFSLIGDRLPAEGTIVARELAPGHEGVERWSPLSGTFGTDEFDVSTQREGEGFSTCTSDLETTHWRVDNGGGIVTDRIDSHPDGAATLFEPALTLSPNELSPNVEYTSTAAMRVVRLSNLKSERDRGEATRRVRYAADQLVDWEGRRVRAKVVEVHFTADLKTARAERRSELWLVPDEGIIAERWNETIVILKVFSKHSDQFAARRRNALPE
jgi:hypothetical protein